MQLWADFWDLLRDTGEVVDFQTAWQQIEKPFSDPTVASLSDINSNALIQALLNKGSSSEGIQKLATGKA